MLDTARLDLRVRRADEPYKVTFRSGIDGSVQYYAVNPAHPVGLSVGSATRNRPRALFLTLTARGRGDRSGAGVYESKSWGDLVAPTNRRRMGSIGRTGTLDALEVLDQAVRRLHPIARIYLTGHSMGGHGVWHVA